MHECPHCRKESISSWQKVLSVTFLPAKCSQCRGESHIHVMYGLVALTSWIVLTWICIGLAYMTRQSIFLLGSIPALYFAVYKYLLRAPMIAASRD